MSSRKITPTQLSLFSRSPIVGAWWEELKSQGLFKDNKFNRGRLDMVAHRDKEGRLRLTYPDEITPKSITPNEIPF